MHKNNPEFGKHCMNIFLQLFSTPDKAEKQKIIDAMTQDEKDMMQGFANAAHAVYSH